MQWNAFCHGEFGSEESECVVGVWREEELGSQLGLGSGDELYKLGFETSSSSESRGYPLH